MRLIDADALQNILLPITTALEHEYGSLGGAVSGCMKHIDNAPTIDAVPVVRCKDCVNGTVFVNKQGVEYVDCVLDDYSVRKPTDYCSYGKRKEGDDNDT